MAEYTVQTGTGKMGDGVDWMLGQEKLLKAFSESSERQAKGRSRDSRRGSDVKRCYKCGYSGGASF